MYMVHSEIFYVIIKQSKVSNMYCSFSEYDVPISRDTFSLHEGKE